jgi:hypothetical protein
MGYGIVPLQAEYACYAKDCMMTIVPSIVSERPPRAEDTPLDREVDVLRAALALVERRLPAGWTVEVDEKVALGDRRADAVLELHAPDGASALVIVEAKRQLATRDVPHLLEQLEMARRVLGQPAVSMLVARYLSPAAREQIEQRGACYADATGNLYLALQRPALFLRDVGSARDPWRNPGRPLGGLKGPAAARVVRALVDFTPPITVPELMDASGTSTGATYRVVDFLEGEALIERRPRGPIESFDWRAVLERWSQDYGFQQSNPTVSCLHPRGLSALIDSLRCSAGLRYVLTGSLAIEDAIAYAPARLAMIYVDRAQDAIEQLDLRPVEGAANVLLAPTDYDVVFQRTQNMNGLRLAAKTQIVVDLLTAPGRGPSEAQALLDWMSANESAWRAQR